MALKMKSNFSLTILCALILLICHTGCMTTTQKGAAAGTGIGAALGAGIGALTGNAGMGAAIGAGAGAVGGALMGDYIDNKREQAEKAQMKRQLEMERTVPVESEYQKELDAQRSEESSYSIVNETNEDFFEREWSNDHWVYTPTNNPNEANLFRRVKDKNGYWIFIPLNPHEDLQLKTKKEPNDLEVKTELPEEPRKDSPFEGNKDIEEATRRIDDALKAGRNEQK